jgi:hypothetical protein
MKMEAVHSFRMSGIGNPAVEWKNTGGKIPQILVTFSHATGNRESIFCS